MKLSSLHIHEVVSRQLCTGCGTCASIQPDALEMVDTLEHCRRPMVKVGIDPALLGPESDAMKVCPGVHLEHTFDRSSSDYFQELGDGWGPVMRLWEGAAGDETIRWAGSSGGAATALALYCLEQRAMHGVLHTAARNDVPYLNETVISCTREELLARTGSRYAPSSPADGLQQIMKAPAPCVFIGKPCDVAAVAKARKIRPELDAKLGVTIAFFCAGTPSTKGTLALLAKVGIDDPARVKSMRYRGNGWPGMWRVEYAGSNGRIESREMTYDESWGFLQKYRQWRCYICPDHTGEFADIAVGDPWYRKIKPGEAGSSLIVARTKRGLEIIQGAIETGYLKVDEVKAHLLPDSQPNLLKSRGALWGRLLALRLAGASVPKYIGMRMFRFWWSELGWREKMQSIAGTLKRVKQKGLRKRIEVKPI